MAVGSRTAHNREIDMTWQVGDRIKDEWEIYNILRGGMGIVYIVFDEHLGVFAMKTFQDEIFSRNPSIADRFNQEAFAWINLDNHQNVVRAGFLENIEGKPYLIMEYVGGGDLGSWVGTPRLVHNLPQVLRFAIQFCDGMNHALSKGIKAHRDLKPQNCLIAEDYTLKISDFGLARIMDDLALSATDRSNPADVSLDFSRTGIGAGTCTHMAPEQFDDAKNVDVRADIYSFGVILFEMVTGNLPFIGRTVADFESLHKTQASPPLRSESPSLDLVVERCLAKNIEHRFANFHECRALLVDIYETLTNSPAPQPLVGEELSAVEMALKSQSLSYLGRYLDGLACSDRSLQINPDLGLAWNNKGMALSGLRRHEEALECYDRALELDHHEAMAWSNKAVALSETGRSQEGIMCCDRALEIDPLIEMAWNNKGKCLLETGRYKEALVCIEQALELNPRFDQALYNKAVILEQSGSKLEALEWYRRTLEVNPRWWQAWNNVGNALNESEQWEEALVCVDRALRFNPHSEEAWTNKGRALLGVDRLDEALSCYDRSIELGPNIPRTWSNRGTALFMLDRHQEAFACFDKAIEINPREQRVWFGRGIALNDLNQSEEALSCFDREIELNPDWDYAWYCKAMTLAQLDRMEEAMTCFSRTIEANPNNADAWCKKASILSDLDREEEAIDCYESALKVDPSLTDAWFGIGTNLARTGRVSAAIECLQQAESLGHPGAVDAMEICRRILEEE
jgi:tetratricopeptide (TPR) repeat protein